MIECMRKKAKKPEYGQWILVSDQLPMPETEVLITARRKYSNGKIYAIITTAFYEDGKVSENDSCWNWSDIEGEYDEENDCYIIPEGWWENRHFNADDAYNNTVDCEVIAWMPLPEPYSVDAEKPHIEKPQTNADRIRSMTDEELAEFLPIASNFICQPTEECIKNTVTKHCGERERTEECAMKWLRAESEG